MRYYELSLVAFIVASVVQVVIMYTYFSSIFKMRYSKVITIFACITLALLNLSLIFSESAIVNIVVSTLTLVILVLFFSGGLINRLIFAVFMLIAGVISEFAVGYILIYVSGVSPDYVQFGTPEFIYGLMFSRTLLAIIARIISGIARNKKLPKHKLIHWISLIVPPTGALVVLYNFMYLRTHSTVDMISSIIVMLTGIIVITVYSKILLDYEAELKNRYLEELLEHYRYQYFLAEKSEKIISKTKHDIKNILIGFQADLKSQNTDNVQAEIVKLLGEIDSFDGPAASGNLLIDSIINYKASVARRNRIFFSMDLRIPQELKLDSIAICQILGSALDNAIEATDHIEDEESRIVQINASYEHNTFILQVINPYKADVIVDSNGNLLSTKRSYDKDGIGLNTIKSVIAEYDGDLQIDFGNNSFRLSIMLYNISGCGEK